MSRPGHVVLLAKANDACSKVPKLSHAPLRGRGVRERMALDHRDRCSHLTTASGVRARMTPKDAGTSHRAEGQSTSIEPRLYARRSRADGLRLGRASIPRNIPHARTRGRGRQADAQLSSTLVPPEQEHYKGRYEDDRRSKKDHRARRPPTVPMTSRAVPQHVREARGRRLRARLHGASCMQQTNKRTDHAQHAMGSVQHDTQRSPLAVRHCTCSGADWAGEHNGHLAAALCGRVQFACKHRRTHSTALALHF